MKKSPLSAAAMSDHDSSSPPPPTSPPHVAATALLPPPPTPVPPQTPLLVSTHPRAESEAPTTSLPGPAPVAAPRPSLLLLPPPLVGHDSGSGGGGGGATEREHHLDFLPPGYRFHPQDEELVTHYLGNKVDDRPLPPNKIFDVRLYDHNPEYLAAKYPQWGENKWFFFTPRERKYPNGNRPNRAAGDGYWKATGSDKPVTSDGGARVGVKKSLVFYKGKPPNGDKTNWIMNEYRIGDDNQRPHDGTMKLDDWVLCSIHESTEGNDKRSKRRRDEAKPRSTSRGKGKGRKPQPSSPREHPRIEAALAHPKVLDRSSDGGSILQTLNHKIGPHESNKSAHIEVAPYFHETGPYQYLHPSGYYEPFMDISDILYGKYEKLSSIGCLSESRVPAGSDDLRPWATNYQWLPEPLALSDYTCTNDDAFFFLRSSEKHQLLENTRGFDCMDSVRDLISGADANDATKHPSYYSSSNPFGYDMIIHSTNATDSTKPQMDAMAVNPGAIHEAGAIPEAGSIPKTDTPAALKNGAVSETCANPRSVLENGAIPEASAGLEAGAKYSSVPNVDALDWEAGFIGDEDLHPVMHSWAGRFSKY